MAWLKIARVKAHLKCSILNATFWCVFSFFLFFFSPRGIEIRSDMHYGSLEEFEKLTLTQQYIMLRNRGQYLANMIPKLLIPNKS